MSQKIPLHYTLPVIILSTLLVVAIIYAWTEPTQALPGGNVAAPLNVGSASQYKSGALGIGGLFRGYGNAVFDGNVGIGTIEPTTKLHVTGDTRGAENLIVGPQVDHVRIRWYSNNWHNIGLQKSKDGETFITIWERNAHYRFDETRTIPLDPDYPYYRILFADGDLNFEVTRVHKTIELLDPDGRTITTIRLEPTDPHWVRLNDPHGVARDIGEWWESNATSRNQARPTIDIKIPVSRTTLSVVGIVGNAKINGRTVPFQVVTNSCATSSCSASCPAGTVIEMAFGFHGFNGNTANSGDWVCGGAWNWLGSCIGATSCTVSTGCSSSAIRLYCW